MDWEEFEQKCSKLVQRFNAQCCPTKQLTIPMMTADRSPPPGFVLHHESTTSILFAIPKATTSANPGAAPVFLNPVQEYNRDLSIVAIRTWSEIRANEIRDRFEVTKAKRLKNQGQKRTRDQASMSVEENTPAEDVAEASEKRVKTSEAKLDEDVEVSFPLLVYGAVITHSTLSLVHIRESRSYCRDYRICGRSDSFDTKH